jgi:hypothetical protein
MSVAIVREPFDGACDKNNYDEEDKCMKDPITHTCLESPVIKALGSGVCYSVAPLQEWLLKSNIEPATNTPFSLEALDEIARAAWESASPTDRMWKCLLHDYEFPLRDLRSALKDGADRDAQRDSWTPLTYASYHLRFRYVRALLAAGADPNARDGHGFSPLNCAVTCRDLNIVRELLHANGIDQNAPAEGPRTLGSMLCPLHVACLLGYEDMVITLLSMPTTDVFALSAHPPGFLALHCAASRGHEKVVQEFAKLPRWADLFSFPAPDSGLVALELLNNALRRDWPVLPNAVTAPKRKRSFLRW